MTPPVSSYTCVIPTLRPSIPFAIGTYLSLSVAYGSLETIAAAKDVFYLSTYADKQHCLPLQPSHLTRTASIHSFSHATTTSDYLAEALILISTPAGKLNLFNASIVLA